MQAKQKPLILTLKLDCKSQSFFDGQRKAYFPPDRNYLQAHCTLFHQLPDEATTFRIITDEILPPLNVEVTGLMNLGAGVAYRLNSVELMNLHRRLSGQFASHLIAQDLQGFRPHITVQNKVTSEAAFKLISDLSVHFNPFTIMGTGLQIWRYLSGPWELVAETNFIQPDF